jgi:putative transposase
MMREVGAGFEDSDPSRRTLETATARMPRLVVPGVPLHAIQRGNNRQHTFLDDQDYATFLVDLGEAAANHGCAVHVYVVMTNHFHLLLTPAEACPRAESSGRRAVS